MCVCVCVTEWLIKITLSKVGQETVMVLILNYFPTVPFADKKTQVGVHIVEIINYVHFLIVTLQMFVFLYVLTITIVNPNLWLCTDLITIYLY